MPLWDQPRRRRLYRMTALELANLAGLSRRSRRVLHIRGEGTAFGRGFGIGISAHDDSIGSGGERHGPRPSTLLGDRDLRLLHRGGSDCSLEHAKD